MVLLNGSKPSLQTAQPHRLTRYSHWPSFRLSLLFRTLTCFPGSSPALADRCRRTWDSLCCRSFCPGSDHTALPVRNQRSALSPAWDASPNRHTTTISLTGDFLSEWTRVMLGSREWTATMLGGHEPPIHLIIRGMSISQSPL